MHTERSKLSLDRDESGVLEAERTLFKQAASRLVLPEGVNIKPGHVIDRVKEELHKTIDAKRKLLERNFINFRFDEYKTP